MITRPLTLFNAEVTVDILFAADDLDMLPFPLTCGTLAGLLSSVEDDDVYAIMSAITSRVCDALPRTSRLLAQWATHLRGFSAFMSAPASLCRSLSPFIARALLCTGISKIAMASLLGLVAVKDLRLMHGMDVHGMGQLIGAIVELTRAACACSPATAVLCFQALQKLPIPVYRGDAVVRVAQRVLRAFPSDAAVVEVVLGFLVTNVSLVPSDMGDLTRDIAMAVEHHLAHAKFKTWVRLLAQVCVSTRTWDVVTCRGTASGVIVCAVLKGVPLQETYDAVVLQCLEAHMDVRDVSARCLKLLAATAGLHTTLVTSMQRLASIALMTYCDRGSWPVAEAALEVLRACSGAWHRRCELWRPTVVKLATSCDGDDVDPRTRAGCVELLADAGDGDPPGALFVAAFSAAVSGMDPEAVSVDVAVQLIPEIVSCMPAWSTGDVDMFFGALSALERVGTASPLLLADCMPAIVEVFMGAFPLLVARDYEFQLVRNVVVAKAGCAAHADLLHVCAPLRDQLCHLIRTAKGKDLCWHRRLMAVTSSLLGESSLEFE
jgi:hypothetical protein